MISKLGNWGPDPDNYSEALRNLADNSAVLPEPALRHHVARIQDG